MTKYFGVHQKATTFALSKGNESLTTSHKFFVIMVQNEQSKAFMLSALASLLVQVENLADNTAAMFGDDDWQAQHLTDFSNQVGNFTDEVAKMIGYETIQAAKSA